MTEARIVAVVGPPVMSGVGACALAPGTGAGDVGQAC